MSNPRHRLHGPPIALPSSLDRCVEAWWRTRPRTRLAAGGFAVLLVLVAGVGHAASSPYGPPTTAWTARRDLPIGATVEPGDLVERDWPAQLLPDGALTGPVHGTVVAPLPAGAIATSQHLGEDPVAGALDEGRVAVAVPVDGLPLLSPGATIDLVGARLDGTATQLTTGAVVLHEDGTSVWLSVAADDAVEVSGATANGSLFPVLRPQPPPAGAPSEGRSADGTG